jgi:hypothetical protein
VIELSLRQDEARLVYLAIAHHLGRPGSELDPLTKQPVEHGMAEIARELQPQLRMAVSTLNLRDNQVQRLFQGMLGSITELKAYPMLELRTDAEGGGRRSSVPGFDATLRHLFPEVDDDAENAMSVAEQMLLLKRRLDQHLADIPREPEPEPQRKRKRGWWPFGR